MNLRRFMMRCYFVLLALMLSACDAPPAPTAEGPERMEPEVAEPEAPEPDPQEPDPGEPEPAEPEPAEPEPAEPEPAEPEPAEPEPAEPEPGEPEPRPFDCRAIDLGAPENEIEAGRFRVITAPWDVPINGLCPVSDFSITHGADAVFVYTAPHTGTYHFGTVGRGMTGLSLHAACDREAPLLCAPAPHYHDPDLGNRPLYLQYALEAGQTIHVFVDGYRTREVGVEVIAPVGEGEACGHRLCGESQICTQVACAPSTRCWEGICQEPPPAGPVGTPCDDFARCQPDLLCLNAVCAVPPEPVVEETWATWHAGRLFVAATITDPGAFVAEPQLRVGEVTVRAASHGGRHWWDQPDVLVDVMPEVVQVMDGDQVLAEIPVVVQPVAAVGEACQRFSGQDRCALGSLCVRVDPAQRAVGQCVAAEVQAWRAPDGEHVFADIAVAGMTNDERIRSGGGLRIVSRDAQRWVGQAVHPGDTISLWSGHDLFAEDVPVRDPAIRRAGEACDAVRVADTCVHGAACIRGTCEIVEPPVIEDALYIKTRDVIGIWVRGRDPNRDVVGVEIDTYEAPFAPPAPGAWWTSQLTWDGDRFEGWLSDDAAWRERIWRNAALVVVDAEGRRSLHFALEPSWIRDRPVGDDGAICDRIGGLFPCAEGLICDTRDDVEEAPTCRPLDAACDAGIDSLIELDQPRSIDSLGATNDTHATCDAIVRDLPEHRLTFVPQARGIFVAEVIANQGFTLSARRGCHFALSELACEFRLERAQPLDGGGGHGARGQIVFEADAGEQITILVDGAVRFDITVTR